MKNFLTLILSISIAVNLFGQNPVKKYTMLEHFTNSKCSVCASKNPAFYTTINSATNAPNIHHLSIHPSVPYNTCEFYVANKTENQALADYYTIGSTPQVYLNGSPATGSSLITQAKLDAAAADKSPVIITVNEQLNATTGAVDVTVTVKTVDAANTSGDFLLFAAVAEKTINKTTPNGESKHFDVFRKMLTSTAGQPITLPAVGQSATFTFSYPIQSSWQPAEVYTIAYIKNAATKLVLQSGTRFDPVVLDAPEVVESQSVSISPNPATDELSISLGGTAIESVDVFNTAGLRVSVEKTGLATPSVSLKTGVLPSGVYITKIKSRSGEAFGKFVKH